MHHCENKRALWGTFTLSTPPPKLYLCLHRGLSPIDLKLQHKAQFFFLPATAMARWLLCLFWSMPEYKPLFLMEPLHNTGYCLKALVSSKMMIALYWGRDVEIKREEDIWKRYIYSLHGNANYLKKRWVFLVLMPRCCFCPKSYGRRKCIAIYS